MSELQLSTVLAILCIALMAFTGRIPYVTEFKSLWRRALAALLLTQTLAYAVFLPITMREPHHFDPRDVWFPALFAGHIGLIFFLLFWWRLRGDVSLSRFLSLKAGDFGTKIRLGLWYGAACWLFAIVVTATMGSFAEAAGGLGPAEPPAVVLWMANLSFGRKLAVVAVSMTVEEAFFRGFLQPRIGLVATSVLFAIGHFNYGLPLLVVGVFAVALVIGRCFERTGDLLPCMVAHAVFNGFQLFVILPLAVHSWSELPV